MGDNFVNLHVHSCKSLLDGMIRIPDLIEKLKTLEQDTVCITDHGNMYCIIDLFQAAYKNELKPIAAFEAYTVPDARIKGTNTANDERNESEATSKRNHLILWAKNNEGYKKLSKICSLGFTEGFYYRPRIDNRILEEVGTEGIMGSTACIASRVDQYLLHDDYESARKELIYLYKLFHEEFWIELQPTEMPEQVKVNKGLIELHKELGIPCILTTDAHYLNKEDKSTHDALLCLQSKRTLDDPNRWTFHGNSYYIMGRDEVLSFMKKNGHEQLDQKVIAEAADQTVEVAKRCNVHFDFSKHYLPKIEIAETEGFKKFKETYGDTKRTNSELYLQYLCIKNLIEKHCTSKEYIDRLNFELNVINSMEFPDYFLIYEDIARYCRDHNIPLGPGRGCGTGDNIVNTKSGDKLLKDVLIGDFVKVNDRYYEVTDRNSFDIDEEIIKITTDNAVINMTKDHKVLAVKYEDFKEGRRQPKWYTMDELSVRDYIVRNF